MWKGGPSSRPIHYLTSHLTTGALIIDSRVPVLWTGIKQQEKVMVSLAHREVTLKPGHALEKYAPQVSWEYGCADEFTQLILIDILITQIQYCKNI